jgi:hypothetical protein
MAGSDIYVSFGGSTEALEASLASAKTAVSNLTRELAALSREQAATGASADSAIGQRMLAVAAQLSAAKNAVSSLKGELGGVGKEAGGIGQVAISVSTLGDSLKRMAEIAGIAFSVEAIKDWISSTTEAAEKIEQVAAKLGASPEAVQRLGAEAKLAGVDFAEMQTQMQRLQLSLAKTQEASSPAAAALRVLGVDVAEFRGASMTGQLDLLSAAVSRYADGANKTAAMQALLGRSGADMIPFLDRGRQGIEELNQAIERTGVVMSAETIAAFAKTKEDISEMSLAWQGFSEKLYSVVNPAVDAAIKEISRLIESMNVSDVRAGVESLTDTAIDLAANIEAFAVRASSALGGLGQIMANLAKINNMTPGELNTQALKDLFDLIGGEEGGKDADAAQTAAQKLTDQLAAISKGAEDAKAKMHALYASGGGSPYGDLSGISFPGAGKPSVPQMDLGGGAQAKQADEAVKEAYDGEVQAAQQSAKRIEESLAEQLKAHQITMQQWLAQTNVALDAEAMAVISADQKAEASAALTSNQKIVIANKEAATLAAIALEEQKAQDKAAEQSAAAWKSAADQIAGAMNSQVDGLLKGTTTVQQAFKNMAASMIEDVIKFCVKWVAEQAAAVAANIVGLGTQTAATATATAASAAAAKPGILASIGADVGEAFAGFSAFFAPTLGPAAPGAAAALAGGVQATAVGMAALDVGGFVQSSGVAMIHAGETVVPAKVSTPYAGGPGGGTTHIWNVTATDPQSFVAQLRNNSSELARTVRDVFNSQQSLRPSY